MWKIEADNVRDLIYRYEMEAAEKLYMKPSRSITGEIQNPDRELAWRGSTARRELENDLELPANFLLVQNPELFSEADSLNAESQFRLVVVPPLLAITALLALSESAWWWTGIIPTAIPMLQGHTRRMDFRTLMVGAVESGIVRSRSFDDYKEWVDSIPELTPAEKQLHEQRLRDQLHTPCTEEELDQLDPDRPKDKHPSAE